MDIVRIATRKSPLALWQAQHVADQLRAAHAGLDVELVSMSTQGDKLTDAPLAKVGGKGLFVKELENALLDGRADIAVHSMKDVPVELPDGLHIPAVMQRGDVEDALVGHGNVTVRSLPSGSVVGTSSLRRSSQLLSLRPDLVIKIVRGGVHTRLAKFDAGEYDALILAAAGLNRMDMGKRISQRIGIDEMLPAVGQGTLGIECRNADTNVEALLKPLHHEPSSRLLSAERAMNRRLNGGCQVPIAGHAWFDQQQICVNGLVASLDGKTVLKHALQGADIAAVALGEQLAEALLAAGADKILSQVYAQAGD